MIESFIFEPDNTFDFNNLQLITETTTNNPVDSLYIKFIINDQPLLIQSPKCITKQGIINDLDCKTTMCDLVFNNKDESFLNWMESFESYCHQTIYNKKQELFGEHSLGTDIKNQRNIEDSFRNTLKPFNAGRSYSLHTLIQHPNDFVIYDENEKQIATNFIVGEQTTIIAILEFKGIRFSSHHFQMDISIKQMMIVNPSPPQPMPTIVSKCLIKKNNLINLGNNIVVDEGIGGTHAKKEVLINSTPTGITPSTLGGAKGVIDHQSVGTINTPSGTYGVPPQRDSFIGEAREDINAITLKSLPTNNNVFLEETNLNDLEVQDTAQIKNRRELFLEIYRDAKQKAKLARNLALMAYLEKIQIKNNYMLEDIESDEDE